MGYYFVGSPHICPEGGGPIFRTGRAPRRDGDMLNQLTAREDGGIDHGGIPPVAHPENLRRLPAATARERNKINSTGGLE
jgi:prolyl-tRNA editing enzyme YbaK/EbsC (Cys-tRNA(Pro) deacylase)